MAAGLGFKDFQTGEVLTAADVDGYLMQGVWVFASAAARDAAVTSPQEGNFAYLKDTNVTTYYTGSAWANLDTTGMTNPMTTTGDTIYSSSGSTPARLGIGSTGQVLTVSGGLPVWSTPAGGGTNWTLLNSGGTSLSGTTTTISGISAKDKIMIVVTNASTNTDNSVTVRFNGDTGSNYYNYGVAWGRTNNNGFASTPATYVQLAFVAAASENGFGYLLLTGANSSGVKVYQSTGGATDNAGAASYTIGGYYDSSSTISSISIFATNSGSFDNGTVRVYTSA